MPHTRVNQRPISPQVGDPGPQDGDDVQLALAAAAAHAGIAAAIVFKLPWHRAAAPPARPWAK